MCNACGIDSSVKESDVSSGNIQEDSGRHVYAIFRVHRQL
jgi:hypothetical protein